MHRDDPVVERVRSARKEIAEQCGNDPHKLLEWAKKIEARYADRVRKCEEHPRRKTG